MATLNGYLDQLLSRGRAYFSLEEAVSALGISRGAFIAAAARMAKKKRLACPRRGFYLILRPEDWNAGAPDPVRWIDPLMRYLELDYRVSLLRAAAFHGSSHQAAMVFQVIAPKQLRSYELGRHRLEFIYQEPSAFARVNQPEWLGQIKSVAGYARVAGVELTLLDSARYFHRAAGINGLGQIVKDLGAKADPRRLASAAEGYEQASVRRLGYLLELFEHARQADALESFARSAKSMKPLVPSIQPLPDAFIVLQEKNSRWKLVINEVVETDT